MEALNRKAGLEPTPTYPATPLRPEQCLPLPTRFVRKIRVDEATGCWLWTAGTSRHGNHATRGKRLGE